MGLCDSRLVVIQPSFKYLFDSSWMVYSFGHPFVWRYSLIFSATVSFLCLLVYRSSHILWTIFYFFNKMFLKLWSSSTSFPSHGFPKFTSGRSSISRNSIIKLIIQKERYKVRPMRLKEFESLKSAIRSWRLGKGQTKIRKFPARLGWGRALHVGTNERPSILVPLINPSQILCSWSS